MNSSLIREVYIDFGFVIPYLMTYSFSSVVDVENNFEEALKHEVIVTP